jgi:hypothetical protein
MEVPMNKLTIVLLAAASVAFSVPASAQGFGVYIGVGHPYHYRYYRHHQWWNAYAYTPECRVIVRHHLNRWGEVVAVRRRICD